MSAGIKYHFEPSADRPNPFRSYCGRRYGSNRGGMATSERERVECKRCLTKLALRDAKLAKTA